MKIASSLRRYVMHWLKEDPERIDIKTARTNEEFIDAFDAIIERALDELESAKNLYHNKCENLLTQNIKGYIRPYGVIVIRESHCNGHVDLLLEQQSSSPIRRILAEAKIHGGPKYHIKGMEQLFGYMTGREVYGVVISYFRQANIKGLNDKIMEALDDELPLAQIGKCEPHPKGYKWMFITRHEHSSGEKIVINHAGCNLFFGDADAEQAEAATAT